MSVSAFLNLAAVVVTLAAVFGYVNHRWLRLPNSIGLVVIALGACVLGFGMGMQMSWAGIRMYALIGGIEVRLIPPMVPIAFAFGLLLVITIGSVTPMIIGIARQRPRVLLATTRG